MTEASAFERPVPRPTPISKPFWDGLRERKVMIQYSPSADRWVFYPRLLAPGTLADDLEWREVSGEGVLYTFAIARKPTAPPWRDALPQLLAVVQLDQGPRLTTELVDVAPEAIETGMRVRPVFDDIEGTEITLLRYTPAG
jgi:uncharacterized OB-fold protein